MSTFFKIAWRNVWRNKYRSLITIGAISIGVASLIFIRAFVAGAHVQMVKNYTQLVSGAVQIHAAGFAKNMSLDRSMENTLQVEKALKDSTNISAYSQRVKTFVLLSSAEQSSGALLVGVDPFKERQVTDLGRHVVRGGFLSPHKNDQIVLGKGLMEMLNVQIGEKIVIMGQAADGSLASGAFRVCGALDTGAEEIDKGMALITLKAAQQMLVLGNRISEITVRLNNLDDVRQTQEILEERLGPSHEVLTWKEISPIVAQTLEFDDAFVGVIIGVFVLVIAIGILNTMLMGVLERVREFGVMLALGTRQAQIVLMVAIESLLLGVVGTAGGFCMGLAAGMFFGIYGVDLSFAGSAVQSWYVGVLVYPRLTGDNLLLSSVSVLAISVLASIYPAWKAAKLIPREALRHF